MSTSVPSIRQPVPIEEDSIFCKAVACIPLLGEISGRIQVQSLMAKVFESLDNRADKPEDKPRAVELLTVVHQYCIANIVSRVLPIALLVSGIALGVLSSSILYAIPIACFSYGTWRAISATLTIKRSIDNTID